MFSRCHSVLGCMPHPRSRRLQSTSHTLFPCLRVFICIGNGGLIVRGVRVRASMSEVLQSPVLLTLPAFFRNGLLIWYLIDHAPSTIRLLGGKGFWLRNLLAGAMGMPLWMGYHEPVSQFCKDCTDERSRALMAGKAFPYCLVVNFAAVGAMEILWPAPRCAA